MAHVVQSVLLRRSKFSKAEAFQWMRDHGYATRSLDVTPGFYRFRQQDPARLHGARHRTIDLGDVGYLLLAYL